MENYSFFDKKLHEVVLGSNFVKKSLFELEKSVFYKAEDEISKQKHVFISGMPRSGTTILLNNLYKSNYFASLTYKDAPFFLSPNFSKFLLLKKKGKLKLRYHNDGIYFNQESPEAFDEIFFKTFNEHEIKKNLIPYISLILKKNFKTRYLSKNNMIYSKINLIKAILPNSIFLIPYRDPVQQSLSLLKQHENFTKLQKKNLFILKYMNLIYHNEFGIGYKFRNKPLLHKESFNLNHWLEQWYLFYNEIINKYLNIKNVFLISYEKLCLEKSYSEKLYDRLEILKNDNEPFNLSKSEIDLNTEENILKNCYEIYKKLNANDTNF